MYYNAQTQPELPQSISPRNENELVYPFSLDLFISEYDTIFTQIWIFHL